ncbi:MAG: alpha-glucosidase [Candidatus Lokiarchaeota archaeon]|nr:alpha-glucosidase [Candidatus Lokiarchaeota archaeon]
MANVKIVLIGAGSLSFGLGTAGNILQSEILKGSTIFLHDINEENLNLAFKACRSAIEKNKLDFSLESSIYRDDALKNADFIINSIEVAPRYPLLDQDFRIPQEYGCKQVSGENGGPGGLFHSLRVIPPILKICADIRKMCPNAFLINFSNPMSRICLAINRKYPNLKFVGLCHEYFHFLPILSNILDIPSSKLEITAGGLNHFGVFLTIKYKKDGKDAYPELRKKGPSHLMNLNAYDGFKLVGFILKNYGYCPYTTDSHYGEYLQWAWEKADISAVRHFWKSHGRVITKYRYDKLKKMIEKGRGARVVKADDERAIPIIEGIISNSNHREYSVNIPNEGVFSNLPNDAIVECPAIVNKDGLNGIALGVYPVGLAALLRNQYSVQDLVVEAAIEKSKDLALQALLADPVVDTYWQANKILERFLDIQAEYIQLD